MTQYTGRMPHSRETLKRFTRLQYDTFEFGGKLIFCLVSLGLIIFGASRMLGEHSILGIASLLIGCLVMTNLNAKADSVADDVAKALGGKYPTLEYSFQETGFRFGEEEKEVSYRSLFRLIADEEYLYLFTSKASGYMVLSSSITAENENENALASLQALIADASGLSWTRPLSIWSFSAKDLKAILKK